MPTDHELRDALIPQAFKPLYESLVSEGNRDTTSDKVAADTTLRDAIERGFADTSPRNELTAVCPSAVFERVLVRWLDRTVEIRERSRAAYLEATAIQQRLLRRRIASAPWSSCVIAEKAQVAALHHALSNAAHSETRSFGTGPYGETRVGQTQQNHFDNALIRYLPPDSELLRRGGSIRRVCDRQYLRHLRGLVVKGHADGEEVVVREKKLPMKLLIVDDHTALVPLGPYGHPALLIRAQGLVALFRRFFDLVWDTATPYEPNAKRSATQPKVAHHKLLELMATGMKDEAIARQCDVSVKTVRRHIAKIMNELGARNRFAAGVAAVRLGLI